MKEFLEIIFGNMSLPQWWAFLVLAIIGSIAFSGMEVIDRNVESPKTPRKFSWNFLAKDNIKRYFLTALLVFIQIRFYSDINHVDLTPYTAILIGFDADGIAGFAKRNAKIMQADRKKLMREEE